MKQLDALIFLLAAAACYLTAWSVLIAAVTAYRRRALVWVGALGVAGASCAVLAWTSTLPSPARPLLFLPVGLLPALAYLVTAIRTETWQQRKSRRADGRQVVMHLVLVTGCYLFSLPYAWMVFTSLKPDNAIFTDPGSLPKEWRWSNYPRTFEFLERALGHVRTMYGGLFVVNTLQVTGLSMASMLASSSMVAFAFARLRWPGRDVLFMVLLGTMMLPAAVTMIPRFLIFKQLGWIDTLLPLWVPSLFASAFDVFLLRQFMLTIPTDLEDAAKIDGCGYFTIYWRVMLPLIKPALAALAIMHFLVTWNDFLGPLIYISSPEQMTGSYALRLFQSANSGEWALLLAAATLWTLPVIALFFFAQRAFIEGIALTGMKN